MNGRRRIRMCISSYSGGMNRWRSTDVAQKDCLEYAAKVAKRKATLNITFPEFGWFWEIGTP